MNNYLIQSQKIEEFLASQKVNDLKKEYKDLSLKYRGENINSASVVNSRRKALSYVSSRMPETSVIIDDVLKKLNGLVDMQANVCSVLDLGSGTGSGLWALENYVNDIPVVAVEREEEMLKCLKSLAKDLCLQITSLKEDVLSSPVKNLPRFDLVIESFMLNEMVEDDCLKALNLIIEKANKYIVLVEPGTPKSYQTMMKIREYLLSKGLKIVLPCPHSFKCGLDNDYCNFSVRVNRTRVARQVKNATLGYEDEKYFYLIFSKTDKFETCNSTVIRRPVFRKSCVDLKLCNSNGSISNVTITKKNKSIYAKAKHIKQGDRFESCQYICDWEVNFCSVKVV